MEGEDAGARPARLARPARPRAPRRAPLYKRDASVDQAIGTLCATLDDLEGSLETFSEQGVARGVEIVPDLDAFARALETAADALDAVIADDVAAKASSLASDIEAGTAGAGEDARARAADGAVKLDELSTEVDCSRYGARAHTDQTTALDHLVRRDWQ